MIKVSKQILFILVFGICLILCGTTFVSADNDDPGIYFDDEEDQDSKKDKNADFSGYDIRVLISSSSSSYTIEIEEGEYILLDSDEDELEELGSGDSVTFSYSGGSYQISGDADESDSEPFLLYPLDEDCLFELNGKPYRGGFQLKTNGRYYYGINVVDVEQYLYGVVGQELGYNFDVEALKAQAVASRSYAISNIKSTNKYYDVTATTSSQVYGGYDAETEKTREAVDDTRGMVITYKDKVVQAYYSSNHGGYSEDIEKVWYSDDVPIKGVPSPYDAMAGDYSSYGASCYSWTVEYTPEKLVSLANSYGKTDIGDFESIEVSQTVDRQTSVSGRAMKVTINGSDGSVSATKDNIRSLLNLKSTLIDIQSGGNAPSKIYVKGLNGTETWSDFGDLYAIAKSAVKSIIGGSNADEFTIRTASGKTKVNKDGSSAGDQIVINGYGFGHGVGMSQWGAIAMADDGYDWDEIIEHYYCSGGLEITEYYE